MTVALTRVRGRVMDRIRETNAREQVFNPVEIDNAICDAYLMLQSRLPAPRLYSSSALTIAAGGDTFTLPATVTQWTGGDGGAEYAGDVRLRLVSTGEFLRPASVAEVDSFRNGNQTVHLAIPEIFALWEDKTQVVNGRCYPGAEAAQACDMFHTLSADDLRDFVGSGADDMDDVEVQFSRIGSTALVIYTAGDLVARMSDAALEARGLDRGVAAKWTKEANDMLFREAGRRHALEATGRF